MENLQNLQSKLLLIQTALRAPKNQYNSFGKYSYRSCEDILEAVKPLLLEAGLVLLITDEIVQIGERYYVKATCHLTDGDKTIMTSAFAREEDGKKGMDGSQVTGAASSYARKYALNGLFCIDDAVVYLCQCQCRTCERYLIHLRIGIGHHILRTIIIR